MDRRFESVFSKKVKAGRRRTYFFDVRQTKGDDYYLTITESTKKYEGSGYERHKIFLYKEDFNRFVGALNETVNHIKTDLMPDYDYEEFDRKQEEWERARDEGRLEQPSNSESNDSLAKEDTPSEDTTSEDTSIDGDVVDDGGEDSMDW